MATVVTPGAQARVDRLERIWAERKGILGWLTTTDHKRIGIMFFFTSLVMFAPGNNIDFYGWGLIFNGISSTCTAINIIVTTFKLRAPGMSINRMPLFCFAFLAVAFSLLFALPSLSVATLFLELDRNLGFNFYNAAHGGDPLLWQNLFWIFGHPEVYIIILPAFGIATAIIPTFTHRRMD